MLKHTSAPDAPAAIGPYSQAVRFGSLLFTSGTIPADPASGEIRGNDVASQAEQAVRNLEAVLRANGAGFDDVIKTTCFLTDMSDYAAFNEVYARYFRSRPARTCVAVSALPKNALCEIEAVAAIQE